MDSREVEQGEAIRRRRECISCTRRFTTVERVSQAVLWVVKRSAHREPFDRRKVIAGARAACKNRPVEPEQLEALAAAVEKTAWALGPEVQSEQVGLTVLEALRALDDVAAVRFASVYKGFEQVDDFARELGLLNKDATPQAEPSGADPGAKSADHRAERSHERCLARRDAGKCTGDLRPSRRSGHLLRGHARALGRRREHSPCRDLHRRR